MRAPRDAAAAGASDVVSARLQLTAGAHSLAHALRSVSAHSFLPSLLRPHFTWQAGKAGNSGFGSRPFAMEGDRRGDQPHFAGWMFLY